MSDLPKPNEPAWVRWLPLAREILAHPVYSGARTYGAGGSDAKAELEVDAKRIAQLLARRVEGGPRP